MMPIFIKLPSNNMSDKNPYITLDITKIVMIGPVETQEHMAENTQYSFVKLYDGSTIGINMSPDVLTELLQSEISHRFYLLGALNQLSSTQRSRGACG
jgi:hypothetical protein